MKQRCGFGALPVPGRGRVYGVGNRIPVPPQGLAAIQIETRNNLFLALAREQVDPAIHDDWRGMSFTDTHLPSLSESLRPRFGRGILRQHPVTSGPAPLGPVLRPARDNGCGNEDRHDSHV